MRFDEAEIKMRRFEAMDETRAMPGVPVVARIDGRSFTRLTQEVARFEAPFDKRFSELMISTTRHLCEAGFQVAYGYTQSDEISLLFRNGDDTFQRKIRKWNSILASEAGACFSLNLGKLASFDCRIIPLPRDREIMEYFQWRQEDASRNALNAHCYWLLRKQGLSNTAASELLRGMPVSGKHDLLFQNGVNYDQLPLWQKRGVGVCWQAQMKEGVNALTGEVVQAARRTLVTDRELPRGAEYEEYLRKKMAG